MMIGFLISAFQFSAFQLLLFPDGDRDRHALDVRVEVHAAAVRDAGAGRLCGDHGDHAGQCEDEFRFHGCVVFDWGFI